MSENVKVNNTGGIGFFGLLTLIFITLKLTNYIDWSWWWVLAPLWIPIVLVILILLGMLWITASKTK
jgi:hypothetical protein